MGTVALIDREARRSEVGGSLVSDCLGEFVECGGDSEVTARGVEAEFVVSTPQILHECVTADHHRRASIGLETAHRSESRFEPAMIALDAVVGVLVSVMERTRDQILDHRLQRLGQVGNHLVGFAVGGQRGAEESAGRANVTASGHVHVDDLAVLVYGAVHVAPSTRDFHIGLIGEPSPCDGVAARSGGIDQQRREALDPPVDGDVIDLNDAAVVHLDTLAAHHPISRRNSPPWGG